LHVSVYRLFFTVDDKAKWDSHEWHYTSVQPSLTGLSPANALLSQR
jgi:hypothetical protein